MIIAFEGIDGSGKGTQAAALQKRLTSAGRSSALLSFPRYSETLFGRLIGDYLNGRFGTLEQVHPLLASLLFSGDRFESLPVLETACAEHEVVLLDRYTASNVAHQGARADAADRSRVMELIDRIEHEVFGLRRADVTILLDLPAEQAGKLIARKAARDYTDRPADLHEADLRYLDSVRQTYRQLADEQPGWRLISVMHGGAIRPVDEIADEIFVIATERLAGTSSPE